MAVETKRTGSGLSALGIALAAGLIFCLPGLIGPAKAQTSEHREAQRFRSGEASRSARARSFGCRARQRRSFVADPDIADVQAQSPSIIYLFGKRAGSTSMFAVDENDNMLLRSSVQVNHNLAGLRGRARSPASGPYGRCQLGRRQHRARWQSRQSDRRPGAARACQPLSRRGRNAPEPHPGRRSYAGASCACASPRFRAR